MPKKAKPAEKSKVTIYLSRASVRALELRRTYLLSETKCSRAGAGMSNQINEAVAIAFPRFMPR